MSTRACIARKTEAGFAGRYHHWDGYPSGLGAELFDFFQGRDIEDGLRLLIDDHPGGWSTIVGADWSKEPGAGEDPVCKVCERPHLDHLEWPEGKGPGQGVASTGGNALGHAYDPDYMRPKRPACYCHGGREESAYEVTHENAAGSGCEYAYVIEGTTMYVCSSYCAGGQKMIGMFGSGDPEATWRAFAEVDLRGPAPDWDAMNEAAFADDDEDEEDERTAAPELDSPDWDDWATAAPPLA